MWDTDASGPLALAERLRGDGPVYIPHYGEWATLWWLLATRSLRLAPSSALVSDPRCPDGKVNPNFDIGQPSPKTLAMNVQAHFKDPAYAMLVQLKFRLKKTDYYAQARQLTHYLFHIGRIGFPYRVPGNRRVNEDFSWSAKREYQTGDRYRVLLYFELRKYKCAYQEFYTWER